MAATSGPAPGVGLPPVRMPEGAERLRREVRAFVAGERARGRFEPRCDAWLSGFDPAFSRDLAARGWVGMTWPEEYGGHGRPALERYVVAEELLAAGAPVAAHWFADRQSGPQVHKHGTEPARRRLLTAIAAGECFVSLGMSEPDSGSDLASVRTRGRRADGGWVVSGNKVWTSHAHRSHFISVLCRTSESDGTRHQGLSVLLVDLAAPGVAVRPITLLNGERDLNEVFFEDVFVPDEMLVGAEGKGWAIVTSELSLERSGPERFLSTYPLFLELVRAARTADVRREVGSLVAELWTLRRLSMSVAAMIDDGRDPAAQAALVKDLGTCFERRTIDVARLVASAGGLDDCAGARLEALISQATLASPGFTLRGGTNEILRGIVARTLCGAR